MPSVTQTAWRLLYPFASEWQRNPAEEAMKVRTKKLTLVCISPSEKRLTLRLPYGIAWAAAQGIARDTHHAVILIGERGTAAFEGDGSGQVRWNEKSGAPGVVTKFNATTIVCI
jgi:hypothetical protein